MSLDSHVKYSKSIEMKDNKIAYALLEQKEKNNCNFPNHQELLNAILDLTNA